MSSGSNNTIKINNDLIKERRSALGYTQEQLSELTNISRSQLQRIENGNSSNANFKTIYHLCTFLNIKFEDVVINIKGGNILK